MHKHHSILEIFMTKTSIFYSSFGLICRVCSYKQDKLPLAVLNCRSRVECEVFCFFSSPAKKMLIFFGFCHILTKCFEVQFWLLSSSLVYFCLLGLADDLLLAVGTTIILSSFIQICLILSEYQNKFLSKAA